MVEEEWNKKEIHINMYIGFTNFDIEQ